MHAPLPDPTALLQWSADDRDDLDPAPIAPAQIQEGDPVASSRTIAALPDGLSVWLWHCTAGRFTWHYDCDEIVHIISGGVIVTGQDGEVRRLGKGDVAVFAAGTSAVWHVQDEIRKVAVTRVLSHDPLSRFARGVRRTGKRLLRPEAHAVAAPALALTSALGLAPLG